MFDHWASKYIGDPWVVREHDCWGFVRRVYQEQFNLFLPIIEVDALNQRDKLRAFAANPEKASWLPKESPTEGDVVLLSLNQRPSHVGIWLDVDGGGVLHCVQHRGVIFNPLSSLPSYGWNLLGYYQRIFLCVPI